jgi:NhaA family Na+:H+ antiporter
VEDRRDPQHAAERAAALTTLRARRSEAQQGANESMLSTRLDRPVDPARDHVLGDEGAAITLVEYGSYACSFCRAANDRLASLRDQLGDRLRYVFRHRPLRGSEVARRAAELVERSPTHAAFWRAHVALMTRSPELTDDDIATVAREVGIETDDSSTTARIAQERVAADEQSAATSGVMVTPTFFINGRRYDGAWDDSAFEDAMLGSLGYKIRAAALDFASWAPSAGMLLLLMSIVAVVLTNSDVGPTFSSFWEQQWGVAAAGGEYRLPLLDWINHGLLSIFFLVVGLEIKREFTVGHLANLRAAALPVAAAIGGMVVPATIYALLVAQGSWSQGWGVPMATDTAFAVALIATLGSRVPIELRIFLTAATIVDDIGAISVVAVFYTSELHVGYLGAAAVVAVALACLNRAHVYRVTPYALLGVLLWIFIHASGVHSTLAAVILALLIPTRRPPNLSALMAQANAIIEAEAQHGDEVLRHGPSLPALRSLDAIHERLESPADRLLRNVAPRSSYVVLPLFALANAGVVLDLGVLEGREPLFAAIAAGLVVGKPLGMIVFCAAAVWLRLAVKPAEYSWRQLAGAGALSGMGFTMSLFIAAEAFPLAGDFAAAKMAVFAASFAAAVAGVAILAWPAAAAAREAAEGQAGDSAP